MSKTVTTVDGAPAVIDGSVQPPLITASHRTLAECMERLAKTQSAVIEAKAVVKDAGQQLKDARDDLSAAVESAIDAYHREGPGGQLSLDAAERIRNAALQSVGYGE